MVAEYAPIDGDKDVERRGLERQVQDFDPEIRSRKCKVDNSR